VGKYLRCRFANGAAAGSLAFGIRDGSKIGKCLSIVAMATKDHSPPAVVSLLGSFISKGVSESLIAMIPKMREYPRESPTILMLTLKKYAAKSPATKQQS
jgi:hypothetical protein